MAPKIIADSDGDESEPSSPSHIPFNNIERTTSSAPGIDHQSGSTDPSFFNSVFNEQQDAAREQPANRQVVDLAEESEVTELVSFDQGFGRVENAQPPVEKSPWDVPSSPETTTMKPKRSAKRTAESNARTKMTRGMRRQLDDIGYRSPDDEPTTPEICSKKRRTQPEMGMTDDLPSTMPIGSDDSLLVAPKARTSARKKKQYSHDGITAVSSPTQPLKPCSINIRSSGSATNVNTPRETFTPLAKPFSPERPRSSTREEDDVVQRGMSPSRTISLAIQVDDEHAAEASEGDDAPYQQEPATRDTNTRKPRGRPKKTVDATAPTEETVVAVDVKKKRGRPKKSAKVDQSDDRLADVKHEAASTDMKPLVEFESPIREPQKTERNSANRPILQDSKALDTHTEDKASPAPTTPMGRAEHTDDSVKKEGMKKKAGATPNSSGRQLYRVGLSRKTKIAPLLKMIRK
ncbi:hypothetical protein E4U55_000975 [Claviceps digitariae]|nr:hypothetical protein E4U55_000975 [Claviceps digitariae]